MIKKFTKLIFIFLTLTYQACNHAEEVKSSKDSPTPSFNCILAKTTIEKSICDNKELATLDREVADLYKKELKINADIKAQQKSWIKDRNNCIENSALTQCLIISYKNRKETLTNRSTKKNSSPHTAIELQKLLNIDKQCSSHSNESGSPYVEKFELDKNRFLLLILCDEGAYQNSYQAFLLNDSSKLESAHRVAWSIPQFDKQWNVIQTNKITGNFFFNESKTMLEVTDRSNGAGTCGFIASFDLSKIAHNKPIQFIKAIGEDDCFAGIQMNDWDEIKF